MVNSEVVEVLFLGLNIVRGEERRTLSSSSYRVVPLYVISRLVVASVVNVSYSNQSNPDFHAHYADRTQTSPPHPSHF